MPCTDGGPSREQIERDRLFHEIMTRLSCDRCRELERKGGVPSWALPWWTNHKVMDADRRRRSKAAQREETVRKRAMAKLTQEEREELGV